MKYGKILSVIVVLTMITVPFYVIGETEASDSNVDTLSLDELIAATISTPNKYWIKATTDADDNVILENNKTGSEDCLVQDYGLDKKLIIENNFTIPKNSAIDEESCNLECNDKEITVYGQLCLKYVENCKGIIIDGGKFTGDYFHGDQNIKVQAIHGAVIDYLFIYDNIRWDYSITFENIRTDDSENGFTIDYDKSSEITKISGIAIGNAYGTIHLSGSNITEIDNLTLNYICLDLSSYEDGTTVLYNDFILYNTGSYIILPSEGLKFDNIVSKSGEVLLASLVQYQEDWFFTNNSVIKSEYSFYSCTVDTYGIKDARTTLLFLRDDGIDKINITSEYENVMFVKVNEKINLNEIKVECSNGYVFDGWYTINDFGYEEKVLNPESFETNTSVILIAKAIPAPVSPPVIPEQKDYTVYFIVIIAMIVILALLALLYYLRCEGILFAKK